MKDKVFYLLLCLFTSSCSLFHKSDDASDKKISDSKKTAFFVSVPITKFSSIQSPCLDVDMDEVTFSMELDLGFRGDLSISQNLINDIPSKTFVYTKPMHGIRGTEYPTNFYRIPKITIGSMSFIQATLEEETTAFIKDSVFVQNGKEPSPPEPGRLGWELFYHTNLLIDAKHAKIAFCDSLQTLKQEGYAIENFVKTALILDRGCVEFEAKTPKGTLRCLLDTGATLNMLNSQTAQGDTIEEAIWKSENDLEYASFQIDSHDLGPVSFRQVPLKTALPIEAILGMQFVQDHLIFLDFSGGVVYFAKNIF
jgi:hypothetical protein